MNILFATDLDGTIITQESNIPNDFICISTTKRGTSGMSLENYNTFLELSKNVTIVPITTRGFYSYKTLNFGISFPYALIDSGAILLKNGTIDKHWLEVSQEIFIKDKSIFLKGKKYLESQGYQSKTTSEFVIDYLTTDRNEIQQQKVLEELQQKIGTAFDVFKAGKSGIFATHKKLSKGNNLKRFLASYYPDCFLIVAGDSKADWSLFSFTLQSIGLSDSKATFTFNKDTFYQNPSAFLDFVLASLKQILY